MTLATLGEPDVAIDTTQGSVSVKVAPQTATNVAMQTEGGNLATPESIHQGRQGALKLASGRLPGSGHGSISLKSKSGNLRVH